MSSAKNLNEILLDRNLSPENKWGFKSILTDDSLSYVVWNKDTNEGLVVDPVKESIQLTYDTIVAAGNIRWLIFDTHTHADHVSGAAELSKKIKAPLLMHEKAPSRRVDIRISRDISWPLTSNFANSGAYVRRPLSQMGSFFIYRGPHFTWRYGS
jgi:glyoxylase-like metal-dependent hydrolase (beta-lactamase superfamily II)